MQEGLALSLLLKKNSYVIREVRRLIVFSWEGPVIQGEKRRIKTFMSGFLSSRFHIIHLSLFFLINFDKVITRLQVKYVCD